MITHFITARLYFFIKLGSLRKGCQKSVIICCYIMRPQSHPMGCQKNIVFRWNFVRNDTLVRHGGDFIQACTLVRMDTLSYEVTDVWTTILLEIILRIKLTQSLISSKSCFMHVDIFFRHRCDINIRYMVQIISIMVMQLHNFRLKCFIQS